MAVRVACGVLGEPGRLLIAPHTPQASAEEAFGPGFPRVVPPLRIASCLKIAPITPSVAVDGDSARSAPNKRMEPDALQLTLRFSFRARLMPSVRHPNTASLFAA